MVPCLVSLSATDWIQLQFDVDFVPLPIPTFGISDLVIGSVSTVYTPPFLEDVVSSVLSNDDLTARPRMEFSTICNSRREMVEDEEEAKTKSKFKSKSVDEDGPRPESLDFSAS